MKILLTTGIYPPDIGGPATYAQMLKERSDFDIEILAYSSRWEDKRVWRKWPKPFRQILFFLKALFYASRADVIYSLSPLGTGVFSAIVAGFGKKPLVVRVVGDRAWEDAVNGGKTHLLMDDFQKMKKRGIKHRLQTWVCRRAKAVIVPSIYLADIVENWGVSREKIKVIPNAVENLGYLGVSHLSKEILRKELGIVGNIIMSAGRLVPWKGFRMLIKIMPQILEINQTFRLVIVGDGPDFELLKTMTKNMNMQNKIYLVGKKDQNTLSKYIYASDIFILNSAYEGFSHQLLEVMATGVPVIASAVGGNRELIQQGENGFLVKYNDEFNIVEAIRTLWKNPDLHKVFAEEGKKTAANYTPERTMQETKSVIESILPK